MTLSKLSGGRNSASSTVVYRLNLAKSYALIEAQFKAYNDQQSDKKDRLKAVHHSLAKKLIELYTGTFWNWQVKNGFSFTPYTPLPYLSINNVTLADWMLCTDRSIRNYRAKLQHCGFIVETVDHGPLKNFEIRINPAFFWLAVNTTSTRVYLPPVQIFPQTSSGYPERELKGTVSGKKPEPTASPVIELEPDVATVPEPQEPVNGNESQEKPAPFGATGTPTGTPPGCAAPPTPGAKNPLQRRAGRVLLKYSLPLLYPKKRYWTAQEKGAMEAQAARLFERVKEENLNKVMDHYCLRALLAAHHYASFTGVPIPPPEVFFNPDYAAGFVLTRHWPQYPEQFPVVRAKAAPKVRTSVAERSRSESTGQIQIGQLFQMMMQ